MTTPKTPAQIRRGLFQLLSEDYTPWKIRKQAREYHKALCVGSTDYETVQRFLDADLGLGRDQPRDGAR